MVKIMDSVAGLLRRLDQRREEWDEAKIVKQRGCRFEFEISGAADGGGGYESGMDEAEESRVVKSALLAAEEITLAMSRSRGSVKDREEGVGPYFEQLERLAHLLSGAELRQVSVAMYADVFRKVTQGLRGAVPAVREILEAEEGEAALISWATSIRDAVPRLYALVLVLVPLIADRPEFLSTFISRHYVYSAAVQHPIRGLFLRSWAVSLLGGQVCDSERWDTSNGEESGNAEVPGPETEDHEAEQGGDREAQPSGPPQREVASAQQRKDLIWLMLDLLDQMLRLVKGAPWARSQSSTLVAMFTSAVQTIAVVLGRTPGDYEESIFPALAEKIAMLTEPSWQRSLTETIIASFDSRCHLRVLDPMLYMLENTCTTESWFPLTKRLLDTFEREVGADGGPTVELARASNLHTTVFEHLRTRDESPDAMKNTSPGHRLRLLCQLLRITLKVYPTHADHVNETLREILALGPSLSEEGILDSRAEERIANSLKSVIDHWEDARVVNLLSNFAPIASALSHEAGKSVALRLLTIDGIFRPCVQDEAELEKLMTVLAPVMTSAQATERIRDIELPIRHLFFSALLKEVSFDEASAGAAPSALLPAALLDMDQSADQDMGDSAEEELIQSLVGKTVFFLRADSPEAQLGLLRRLETELKKGGSKRAPVTLPPLVLSTLRLAVQCGLEEQQYLAEEALKYAASIAEPLEELDPVLAGNLYLQVAEACESCELASDDVPCTVLYRSLAVYEHLDFDSNARLVCLLSGTGVIIRLIGVLSYESIEALSSTVVSRCTRLSSTADQCVALCSAAEMFWVEGNRDKRGVQLCLNRAMQSAMNELTPAPRALLLIDVLVRAASLFRKGCDALGRERIIELHETITALLLSLPPEHPRCQLASARLARLVAHVENDTSQYANFGLRISAPFEGDAITV